MSLWNIRHKIKPAFHFCKQGMCTDKMTTVNYFVLNGPLIIIFERTNNPHEWKTRVGLSALNVVLKA